MDVGHFRAVAIDDKNAVLYDRNNNQRDTALGAWKRPWAVLNKWGTQIMIDARFADMPLICCEERISYCCKLQDVIDARMKVEKEDFRLKCWFFDKPYMSNYFMYSGSYHMCRLEVEARQCSAAFNPPYVDWHRLKRFSVTQIQQHTF